MGNLGFREILVILLIIVILFGAKRIPELMRGMGQGVKEFKSGMRDGESAPTEEKKDAAK
ncbi:MAG: twin-arginine translocase TatA/TatE family subunit [Candidatus Eisenbacteria bacterium]|nr:twin-arginine translocase TatA/TatE family subunit [Candidatus Eisenbacteria bacterium]MCC7143304.1 twin-arginine translocase TatA/TatE family subunit [Candidatus Eisenbacteria bacterium]